MVADTPFLKKVCIGFLDRLTTVNRSCVIHKNRKYQPTARRITFGSNWRHLNKPEIGTRNIRGFYKRAYQAKPPKLHHAPPPAALCDSVTPRVDGRNPLICPKSGYR